MMPKRIRNLSPTQRKVIGKDSINIMHRMIEAIDLALTQDRQRRRLKKPSK